ncbi:hypothetical protein BHE74_00045402 [Ensete ventricosum]|nr:hypothetical protein GW17_00001055 [Ensete ventricosum]RWW48515.1 hypothetical protein BHE74_00045402 [Ensete ventricosum]RZS02088.1 hypothetical protein BHM03_00032060 [Ensete ventricosum]
MDQTSSGGDTGILAVRWRAAVGAEVTWGADPAKIRCSSRHAGGRDHRDGDTTPVTRLLPRDSCSSSTHLDRLPHASGADGGVALPGTTTTTTTTTNTVSSWLLGTCEGKKQRHPPTPLLSRGKVAVSGGLSSAPPWEGCRYPGFDLST